MKKVCTKCKLEKNTSEFCPDKRNKSGLYSACKYCHTKYKMEWKVKNREYCKKYNREYLKRRYQTDHRFHLDSNLRSIICTALKGEKNRRSWQKLVGYTIEDLIKHLENKFTEGMSWDNYGSWEIDHIKPKSLFKYETAEDADFKKCWALENLQPLNKIENRKKGSKYIIN